MVQIRRVVLVCLLVSSSFVALGAEVAHVRLSLPPVMACLPIAFAEHWGLFEEHGVSVELIGITDNQQRSHALTTGNLDAVLEDVTQFVVDCQEGHDLVVTSAAYVRTQTGSLEVALVSPTSFKIESLDDLFSEETLIGTLYCLYRSDHEYMLDRLIAACADETRLRRAYSYFTDALWLATWFGARSLPAAVLPEPYISYIATYRPVGGEPVEVAVLSDFSEVETLPTLVVFRRAFLEAHPEAVEAFYAAYRAAIERLNRTPREELVELGIGVTLSLFFQAADPELITQDVLDAIPIPTFGLPTSLAEETYGRVVEWMRDKGYASTPPSYAAVVDLRFLP